VAYLGNLLLKLTIEYLDGEVKYCAASLTQLFHDKISQLGGGRMCLLPNLTAIAIEPLKF